MVGQHELNVVGADPLAVESQGRHTDFLAVDEDAGALGPGIDIQLASRSGQLRGHGWGCGFGGGGFDVRGGGVCDARGFGASPLACFFAGRRATSIVLEAKSADRANCSRATSYPG